MLILCLFASVAFNGYDSCAHGKNLEPWNLYSDMASAECERKELGVYMERQIDRMEARCSKGERRAAARISSTVLSVLISQLRNDTCEGGQRFDARLTQASL